MKDAFHILRANGFGFVCAMCTKLHRPFQSGQMTCEAANCSIRCGGPIVGMGFPEYEGPISRHMMYSLCFVCGANSTHVVKCADGNHVGCCDDHVKWLTVKGMNDCVQALTPEQDTQDPDVVAES